MAHGRSRVQDGPSFAARFAEHRRLTLLLLPILLLGTVALARRAGELVIDRADPAPETTAWAAWPRARPVA